MGQKYCDCNPTYFEFYTFVFSGVTNLTCHLMVFHTHQGVKHRGFLPLSTLTSRVLPGAKLKDHLSTLMSHALPGVKLKEFLLSD